MYPFLTQPAPEVARKLIGHRMYVREADGSLTGGIIIETEAYTAEDAASHSYRGETVRNKAMFGPAGRIYVYFTYGMHWCMNIVTGETGSGEAVLIRALRPDKGMKRMQSRRKQQDLTGGPAKLCQALGVTGSDNGEELGGDRFVLLSPTGEKLDIRVTERIGIRQDTHRLWRFVAD